MNPIEEKYFELHYEIETRKIRLDSKNQNHIDAKKMVDKKKSEYEKWIRHRRIKIMKGIKK